MGTRWHFVWECYSRCVYQMKNRETILKARLTLWREKQDSDNPHHYDYSGEIAQLELMLHLAEKFADPMFYRGPLK